MIISKEVADYIANLVKKHGYTIEEAVTVALYDPTLWFEFK